MRERRDLPGRDSLSFSLSLSFEEERRGRQHPKRRRLLLRSGSTRGGSSGREGKEVVAEKLPSPTRRPSAFYFFCLHSTLFAATFPPFFPSESCCLHAARGRAEGRSCQQQECTAAPHTLPLHLLHSEILILNFSENAVFFVFVFFLFLFFFFFFSSRRGNSSSSVCRRRHITLTVTF